MSKKLLFRLFALVAAMMCALGASAAEAYANYTPSNTTLTFYYDNLRSSRAGTTYDLNTAYDEPVWCSDSTCRSVTRVVFDSSFADARPTSTRDWFGYMGKLTTITGMKEYLNTSEVISMSGMFKRCKVLSSLDVSNFNTARVTDMSHMFEDCYELTTLDLSNFNTSKVTTMYAMLWGCIALTDVDLSSFDTAKVTNMGMMFSSCYSLTSLDLSSFNTSNVTDMSRMFEGCRSLTILDLCSFNTSKVTDMDSMFEYCRELTTIYVDYDWSTAAVTYSYNMFYDCIKIVGGRGTTYTFRHVDAAYAHIDGGLSNPGYLSRPPEAYACYTPENTTLTFYYDSRRSSREGTTYDLNTGTTSPGWNSTNATKVVFDPSFAGARPTSTAKWFYYMSNLQTITGMTEYLNTSQVTNMSNMFYHCSGLTILDVSHFNTANVTDMSGMFYECTGLTSLDLRSFNTANVTDMLEMFISCTNLTTIYAGCNWTTAAVTSSTNMFKNCYRLVGGAGTTYNSNHNDKTYARIDGGTANPGYFTEWKEAYACYTPTDAKLTFYYDELRNTREGTTYDLNTGSVPWYQDHTNESVMQVEFDSSFADARPTSTRSWFTNMSNLISVSGMQYFNTSEVTNMGYMFYNCNQLTTLDLSHFNTAQVTDMAYMFYQCSGLTSLDLSSFNTAKVTNMQGVFYNCSGLTSLNLSQLNTAKVTNMREMFFGCSSLTDLDLGSFNTSKVTNMGWMFDGCTQLTRIYVGSEWSTVATTTSNYMFYDCTRLVGGQGTTYDANHVDKAYAHIDGGPSNPGYLSGLPLEAYACYTPSNTTLTFYYDNLRRSREGTTYDLNTGENDPGWYSDAIYWNATRVVFDPSFADARPTSTYNWFGRMQHITSISGMKNYLNTSEVTNMGYMFYYCTILEIIDVSGFNTAKVTNMKYMFFYCHVLHYLNLSNFNTARVTNMESMFNGCNELSSLNLSSFNTANVTDMDYMFQGCTGLSNLNMKNLNTSRVTSMNSMFYGCSSLTRLDLSSFNTSNVTVMFQMFRGCSELTTIYVGNGWNTTAVYSSNNMFLDCLKIEGSQGTTYDANHLDKIYARIDGGTALPGYLSEVKESYAVYTPDNTTLTFYYDSQRSSRPGTSYNLYDIPNDAGWYTDGSYESVTQVVFDPSFADARPMSTFCWFSGMGLLQAISGMEYLNTSEVTSMYAMFYCCSRLTSLDLSHFNTAKVTDMDYMFGLCPGLTSLDLSSFNTSRVTTMKGMFTGCSYLTTIYAGDEWSTVAVTTSTSMFKNCIHLVGSQGTTYDADHTDAAYAHIDGGPSNPGYFTDINPVEVYACYTPSNTTLTFYYDSRRSSREGTTYDLNTGSNQPDWVIDQTNSSVTQVVFDPSFADARPVSTHAWIFCMADVQSITGLEYLNTSEATNMAAMFMGCESMTSLDLSHFNTVKVTDMFNMFNGCSNLTSLDVSGFNTANVIDMRGMFRNCSKLTSLDLSSFNTAMVGNMSSMFNGDSRLTTIYAGDEWTIPGVYFSSEMFYGCTSLVGGMGTAYDENHVDAAYAHIDGGPSNPGYFTDKSAALRGDVNGDGSVNIADVTVLIDYLLSANASGINLTAADCNQDGSINIADVTALIDYLLSGTW